MTVEWHLQKPMYDTSESRFMDLSFEKANSAYMLFYRRVRPNDRTLAPIPTVRLSQEILELVSNDNVKFIKDLMFFNHHYDK